MNDLGRNFYGAAALLLAALGFAFGVTAGVWHPLPDGVPAGTPYIIAAIFLLGGAGVQWRQTATIGGVLLALAFLFFAGMWVTRILLLPRVFGTWSGCGEELVPALAGLLIALGGGAKGRAVDKRALLFVRVAMGICVVGFGILHFDALPQTTAMVPRWIPPGQRFWALATGLADVAAGLALISGILAIPAARLLTIMFASFGALIWLPMLLRTPHEPTVWGGNAINLAVTASVWILADTLSRRGRRTR
jgi:uncharacterized membrane protein YphA (DoxX/SURF4 family)